MLQEMKKILSFLLVMSMAFLCTGCEFINAILGASADTSLWDDPEVNDKIDEINGYIDEYFYFEIDEEKQEEALYDAVLSGLDDPYSVYYTEEEFAELQETNSGEYVGIGAVVTQDADMVVSIVRPVKNSPAEESGLMAEDIIVEVDGTEIIDQELTVVVDMIRGEEGTTAHIKIYRPSTGEYMDFDVERRVVENYSVSYKMLEDNIGYILVEQFYDNTCAEFIEAYTDLESQGAKAMVVDLRDNPGGLLTAVVDMCDFLMKEGTIVTTKDKDGNILQHYSSTDEEYADMPIAVLINGNSASASEIFAGALQDTGVAEIIGTTSYGKGIVQSVIPLSDGTAIKITIAKYFTPNGNDIHEIGIVPDYEVELADGRTNAVGIEYADDLQLHKAEEVLKGMIQ
ncbi:MAG: S41 family peptidase [Lachnospiraceae bacterium]|nr:S41 family peptidase [Lachnospiraceae bacterium]